MCDRHDDTPTAPRRRSPHARGTGLEGSRFEEHPRQCPSPTLATDDDLHRCHRAVTVADTDHTGHGTRCRHTDTTTASAMSSNSTPSTTVAVSPARVPIRSCFAPRLPPRSKSSDDSEPRNRAGVRPRRHQHHPRKQQKSEICVHISVSGPRSSVGLASAKTAPRPNPPVRSSRTPDQAFSAR